MRYVSAALFALGGVLAIAIPIGTLFLAAFIGSLIDGNTGATAAIFIYIALAIFVFLFLTQVDNS